MEAGPLTFTITYDEAPKSLNAGGTGSRRHWSAGNREKKRWEGIYAFLLLEQKVPRGMVRCDVEFELHFKKLLRRDVENYRSGVSKPLADCLVHGGWLPDDTAEFFGIDTVTISDRRLVHPNPAVESRVEILLKCRYATE